jgi:hypothetical protein
LCRLLADCFVCERSYDIDRLRDMVNIDIKTCHVDLNSGFWLNPGENEMMYLSGRNIPTDLWFSVDNIKIYPAERHTYIGVTFGADAKCCKHIDSSLTRSTKQVARLRKLIIKRYLKKNSRPRLEFLLSFGQLFLVSFLTDFRKFNLKLGESSIGFTSYASISILYTNTWWQNFLQGGRIVSFFIYDFVNHTRGLFSWFTTTDCQSRS